MPKFIHQQIAEPNGRKDFCPITEMKMIERAARTCYQSFGAITDDSYIKMLKMLIKRNHLSPLEHVSYTIIGITNRAMTHQLVRHRIGSYSQESQRYCGYHKDKYNAEVEFIYPHDWENYSLAAQQAWKECMTFSENYYMELISHGLKPEQARDALNNATKTEIVFTFNLRQWLHVLNERTSEFAQPLIKEMMEACRVILARRYPPIFGKEN